MAAGKVCAGLGIAGWCCGAFGATWTLSIEAENVAGGVTIGVVPRDAGTNGSGVTPFSRVYQAGALVTLTAPAMAGMSVFDVWRQDGTAVSTNMVLPVVADTNHTLTAVYRIVPPAPVAKQPSLLDYQPGGSLVVSNSIEYSGTARDLRWRPLLPGTNWAITAVSGDGEPTLDSGEITWWSSNLPPASLSFVYTLQAPADASGTNTIRSRIEYRFDGMPVAGVVYAVPETLELRPPPPSICLLSVESSNPDSGVSIGLGPNDIGGSGDGQTPFDRSFSNGVEVVLTAPLKAGANNFVKWQLDGQDAVATPGIRVTMDYHHKLTAVYQAPTEMSPVAPRTRYSGLFLKIADGGGVVDHEHSGSFQLQTARRGLFSGKLIAGGVAYPFNGQFDTNGEALVIIPRGSLKVDLLLSQADGGASLAGVVTGPGWSGSLLAYQEQFDARGYPAPNAGKYTLLLQSVPDTSTPASRRGFAAMAIEASGRVRTQGKLEDGTAFTAVGAVFPNRYTPLYASLNRGRGSLLGWVKFINGATNVFSGDLGWTKPAQEVGYYPGGFNLLMNVTGSKYRPPGYYERVLDYQAAVVILAGGDFTNGFTLQAPIGFTNRVTGGHWRDVATGHTNQVVNGVTNQVAVGFTNVLVGAVTNSVAVGYTNQVVDVLTNFISLSLENTIRPRGTNMVQISIRLNTGWFAGKAQVPGSKTQVPVWGTLFQQWKEGLGCFTGTNQSGTVILRQE